MVLGDIILNVLQCAKGWKSATQLGSGAVNMELDTVILGVLKGITFVF